MNPIQQLNARLMELAELRQNLHKTLMETEAKMEELHRVRSMFEGQEPEAPKEPEPYQWPEEMFGVKLTGLDDRTRMMVMAGDPKVIESLGGTPPRRAPVSIADLTG